MRAKAELDIIVAITISVVAVAIRFIDINQPFIDEWSWRQSDVASIARNYLHNGFDFAHPQIDWAGDQPGYVGTEFPILPFTVAICYKFLGAHEWIGRLQSLIFFAAALPFFFLLVREVFGAVAAGWALFFYSFAPLNIMASRCFMPDAPSLSLSIIGLYLFFRWTAEGRSAWLFSAAIAISLSLLIKLPSAVIGAPLLCVAYQRYGVSVVRRVELWIFGAIILLPSLAWYWHSYQIAQKFYPHHFFGAGGVRFMNAGWYGKIAEQTVIWSLSGLLSIIALAGIFFTMPTKRVWPFHSWLLAILAFIVVVGYGNRHPWYQLPLVPVAAAFAGASCARFKELSLPRPRFVACLIIIWFGLLSYACSKRFYRETAANLRLLGLELRRVTPEKSLIVAADYGDPTVFYYAERRGWHFMEKDGIYNGHPASGDQAIADLQTLRRKGATHFVVYSGTLWWLDYFKEFAQHLERTATLIRSNPEFEVFKLNSRKE